MNRLIVLLLCAAPLVAAPVPKAKDKEPPTLDGAWEVVDRQNDGKPVKAPPREFWVFGADTYSIFSGIKDETELTDPNRRTLLGSRSAPEKDDLTALDLKEDRLHMAARVLLEKILQDLVTLLPVDVTKLGKIVASWTDPVGAKTSVWARIRLKTLLTIDHPAPIPADRTAACKDSISGWGSS